MSAVLLKALPGLRLCVVAIVAIFLASCGGGAPSLEGPSSQSSFSQKGGFDRPGLEYRGGLEDGADLRRECGSDR